MKVKNIIIVMIRSLSQTRLQMYLVFFVCICSFFLIDQMSTNSFRYIYHQIELKDMLQFGEDHTLMLKFHYIEETEKYVKNVNNLISDISKIEGIDACGNYDGNSKYFSELKENVNYNRINKRAFRNSFRSENLAVSDVIYVSPGIEQLCSLKLVSGNSKFIEQIDDNVLPVLTGYLYKDVAPVGTTLTDDRNGHKYRVVGVIKKGERWYGDVDAVGADTTCLDNKFIIARTQEEIQMSEDIMTTLCILSSSYIILNHDAELQVVQDKINSVAKSYGLSVSAVPMKRILQEYAESYRSSLRLSLFVAAIFILLSCVSISSATIVSILLRKSEYGIMYANGFSRKDISLKIIFENSYIISLSVCIAFLLRMFLIIKSKYSAFSILMRQVHMQMTLPTLLVMAFFVIFMVSIPPIIIINRMKPVEMIGENE